MGTISKQHISVGAVSVQKLRSAIVNPTKSLICVNDVKLPEARYIELRKALLNAFEERFPQKSKYEQ